MFYGQLHLNEKRIKTWVETGVLEGLGTELKPYKLVSPEKLPDTMSVGNLKSHLQISNCTLSMLFINKAENIIIENSKIGYLGLEFCSHITITNNTINNIRLKYSISNVIRNNLIPENIIRNLKMSRLEFPKDELPFFFIFLAALFGTVIFLSFTVLSHAPLGFKVFMFIVASLFSFYDFKKRVYPPMKLYYRYKEDAYNKFIDNKILEST